MILVVAKAIRAALAADAAVAAVVTGPVNGVSTVKIYLMRAAEAAPLPYIVIDDVGGGATNDTPRDAFDLMVQVKAVSDDAFEALQLIDQIRDVLHMQGGDAPTITLDAPWGLVDIQQEEPFAYVEDADRRQYQHAGATYRIRGAK